MGQRRITLFTAPERGDVMTFTKLRAPPGVSSKAAVPETIYLSNTAGLLFSRGGKGMGFRLTSGKNSCQQKNFVLSLYRQRTYSFL